MRIEVFVRAHLAALVLSAAGCSAAGPADGGMEEARPADGGGVCCPMSEVSCDCVRVGGWSEDGSDCDDWTACDVWPSHYVRGVDTHGCPRWFTTGGHPEDECCNCPPEEEDGGL